MCQTSLTLEHLTAELGSRTWTTCSRCRNDRSAASGHSRGNSTANQPVMCILRRARRAVPDSPLSSKQHDTPGACPATHPVRPSARFRSCRACSFSDRAVGQMHAKRKSSTVFRFLSYGCWYVKQPHRLPVARYNRQHSACLTTTHTLVQYPQRSER